MILARLYRWLQPTLFAMDAESAHDLVLGAVGAFPRIARAMTPAVPCGPPVQVGKLQFPGPVGLAAGVDKDARALPLWDRLGFGHVEIGTVTPLPQAGNDRPRVHRFPEHRAIINSMGFPSAGAEAVALRLARWKQRGLWPAVPVGANIGKNRDTPNDRAAEDYGAAARTLAPHVDFVTINVSSPNTTGIRDLQAAEALHRVVWTTCDAADGKPVFVKLAPDLVADDISESVETAISAGASGIVATNTTRERLGFGYDLPGGLSGAPLFDISAKRLEVVLRRAAGRVPVIGVGGVMGPDEARALIAAGCCAVQIYTALVYEGPEVVGRINEALRAP